MYAVEPNQCQPALSNALKHILLGAESKHRTDVARVFEETYEVTIEFDEYNWKTLNFESHAHFLAWYLRWA